MKPKADFFLINKIDKLLARLTKKKREDRNCQYQNKRVVIAINPTNIKK